MWWIRLKYQNNIQYKSNNVLLSNPKVSRLHQGTYGVCVNMIEILIKYGKLNMGDITKSVEKEEVKENRLTIFI